MCHVAGAGSDRPDEVLGRQARRRARPSPSGDDDDDAGERSRVGEKRPAGSGGGDEQPAECRPGRLRDGERHRVQGDRLRHLVPRDELGDDRLLRRHAERGAEAIEGDTGEQQPGRHRVGQRERPEPSRDQRLPRLGGDDETPAVEHVGERAGGQREHERRDGSRGGQQRHESGRAGELDHQPPGGDLLHPEAQVGHDPGRPRAPEDGVAQRRVDTAGFHVTATIRTPCPGLNIESV